MNRLQLIKAFLAVSIVIFTVAGISVSFAVFEQQKAVREVSRYNMVWAVSQAVAEFYRFEQRVAAFAAARADKDEVDLRFEILRNRLGILRHGEVNDFTKARPEERETVDDFARLLGRVAPMLRKIDNSGHDPAPAGRAAAVREPAGPAGGRGKRLWQRSDGLGPAVSAAAALGIFRDCRRAGDLRPRIYRPAVFQNRLLAKAYRRVSALAHDLRIAKNAADAASEAKSRFLATMSHELRTPLNAVIGFSEVIASEAFGPVGKPAYRGYAADILTAGRHMLELVNDVLTMAKLDAGRYELDLAPMNLHDTVDRTVTIFRGTTAFERREIRVTGQLRWPWLLADERAVRQVLLNLLSNAAKFSDPDSADRGALRDLARWRNHDLGHRSGHRHGAGPGKRGNPPLLSGGQPAVPQVRGDRPRSEHRLGARGVPRRPVDHREPAGCRLADFGRLPAKRRVPRCARSHHSSLKPARCGCVGPRRRDRHMERRR